MIRCSFYDHFLGNVLIVGYRQETITLALITNCVALHQPIPLAENPAKVSEITTKQRLQKYIYK